jgi:hypothetical protein
MQGACLQRLQWQWLLLLHPLVLSKEAVKSLEVTVGVVTTVAATVSATAAVVATVVSTIATTAAAAVTATSSAVQLLAAVW